MLASTGNRIDAVWNRKYGRFCQPVVKRLLPFRRLADDRSRNSGQLKTTQQSIVGTLGCLRVDNNLKCSMGLYNKWNASFPGSTCNWNIHEISIPIQVNNIK